MIKGPPNKSDTKNSNKKNENIVDTKLTSLTNKKNDNIGLRIPGSNWERFKNIVKEVSNEEVPQKQKRLRTVQNHTTQLTTTQNTTTNEQANSIIAEKKIKAPRTGLTKVIALDCEMVGIGNKGQDSMIARVSIVNQDGICVYDKYVKPTEEVVDFRTPVSGIRPHHLKSGEDFTKVQKEVSDILKGRILVGHAVHHDLDVLFLSHPRRHQRDTSRYKFFRKTVKGGTPSLKKLASELLGLDIQSGEHNSIEDARAAMQLYMLFRRKWEADIRHKG